MQEILLPRMQKNQLLVETFSLGRFMMPGDWLLYLMHMHNFVRRTRMFYPEASPWRKETIRDKNQTKPLKYLNSEVYTSNRVSEKMKTVGVSASIGASILGGLVKVTGSASYFNDLVIQDNEVKPTIQYLNLIGKA